MGESDGYSSIDGRFTLAGEQTPPDTRVVQVELTRDPGERTRGDWSVSQNASDSRLRLPATNGRWTLTGWCDAQGDHNVVRLFAADSSAAVVTLNEVPTPFMYPWKCGSNFGGRAVHSNGMALDYFLGVLCV